MCYSARVLADYRRYVRMFGATASLAEFVDLFLRRVNDPEARIIIPKGVEAAFTDPRSDEERKAKDLIDSFRSQQATKFEQELFKQRRRLADAERTHADASFPTCRLSRLQYVNAVVDSRCASTSRGVSHSFLHPKSA